MEAPMKINWKLRFQNKVTLTAIVLAVIALVYQILGIIGIVPAVSQETIVQLAGAVINLLVLLGIVVDPTTDGIGDSDRARGYESPYKD
jgi:phi LC3 family holin